MGHIVLKSVKGTYSPLALHMMRVCASSGVTLKSKNILVIKGSVLDTKLKGTQFHLLLRFPLHS